MMRYPNPRAGAGVQHAPPLVAPAHHQHARDLPAHLACCQPAVRLGSQVGPHHTNLILLPMAGQSASKGTEPLKVLGFDDCMPPPRNMSTPVFEEQQLDIMSAWPEFKAALPLGPPCRPARTQALHLATNGDVLIGHADNGVALRLSYVWSC